MKNKKLLGTTLALAMIIPLSQANAELLKNLKLSGQLDLQGTAARNVTDFATRQSFVGVAPANNDRYGDMQTRLMLSLDWDLLDDVHSKITLSKADRMWGTAGGAASITQNANSQAIGAGGIQATTLVDQAYFKVDKVGGAVDTTLGRQFYGTPGDLVIYFGPSDKPWYGLPTNALDAARFDWSNENVGVTAVAGKIVGKLIGTAVPAADIDVTGLVASLKGNENMSGSVYLYNQMTHATGALGSNGFITRTSPFPAVVPVATVAGGRNDMLYVLGVKGKAKMGAAWISGELDKNYGNNRPSASAATAAGSVTDSDAFYRGWAALLDAGYKADVSGVAAFMPWFELGIGSGQHDTNSNKNRQFTAITGDYRPGSIRGRFAAFNNGVAIAAYPGLGVGTTLGVNTANTTLANSVIWGLGVKANPASLTKLTAGLSFWDFRTQTIVAPIMDQNETTARANAAGSQHDVSAGNKHLGSEIDLDLTWKHSENVSFSTGWGSFLPGGIIKEAVQSAAGSGGSPATGTGVSPATLAYFDVRVKF